jgi:peptide deformylase
VAIRPVVRIPNPVLKLQAQAIGGRPDDVPSVDQLVADLVDTMRASPACVGLAAPQIGISVSAFALDVSTHPKTTTCHGLVVLLDPEIVEMSGKKVGREGCMSVPDLTANVRRANALTVLGTTPAGERVEIQTRGFESRAFQHEIDHLRGMLILDRVDSLATDVFRRQVYK